MVIDRALFHVVNQKKFTSQWRGQYTVKDMLSTYYTYTYCIRQIGSPAKDIVVLHNRLKLCYGTSQEVAIPASATSTTVKPYSDIVYCYISTLY